MKLTVYRTGSADIDISPAPMDRAWMDATPERYANRCLPLRIANQAGWVVKCPDTFGVVWTGHPAKEGLKIFLDAPRPAHTPLSAVSHFGAGVLTFTIPAVFRTEPGWQLLVVGPLNAPRLGIMPLSGVVATDWACQSFTMNWRFTEPMRLVRFEKGDPICQLIPVRLADLEAIEPEIVDIQTNPEIARQHAVFSSSRDKFNADLQVDGSDATRQGWQKHYFQGRQPDGADGGLPHFTKLRVCPISGQKA